MSASGRRKRASSRASPPTSYSAISRLSLSSLPRQSIDSAYPPGAPGSRRRPSPAVRSATPVGVDVGSVDCMAHVVVATAFGGPEVLSVVNQEVPDLGAGEVRMAVRAAGINPVDWKRYGGMMGTAARLPMRLGFEAAGVVVDVVGDAVGPAGRVRVGDEVIAFVSTAGTPRSLWSRPRRSSPSRRR